VRRFHHNPLPAVALATAGGLVRGHRIIVNVHRFEHTINGRDYLIEVSSVGTGTWRAQIARVPGGSAALMPFYGKTPDEAARQLSRWLTIAHGHGGKC
jgi:hypothetical protein